MTAATSASDRYQAARRALAEYDTVTAARVQAHPGRLAEALRTLITPPATEATVEQIAERIATTHSGSWRADLIRAVRAGIQAAHESWEPENAPGVRTVTSEEHKTVRRVVLDAIADGDEGEAREPYYYTARIYDALGVTL